jgi:threonine dehydrogenase-like Zn-dependent dehydrogenase
MGNCDHRKIIPIVLDLVRTGTVEPTQVLSHVEPITAALEAYSHFDRRDSGWIKVELRPKSAQ